MTSATLMEKLKGVSAQQSKHKPRDGDLRWVNQEFERLSETAGMSVEARSDRMLYRINNLENAIFQIAQRGFVTQAVEIVQKRYSSLEQKYELGQYSAAEEQSIID